MFEVCRHAAEQPTTLEILAVRGPYRAASALSCLPCASVRESTGSAQLRAVPLSPGPFRER
jgi:hypothetical protein